MSFITNFTFNKLSKINLSFEAFNMSALDGLLEAIGLTGPQQRGDILKRWWLSSFVSVGL